MSGPAGSVRAGLDLECGPTRLGVGPNQLGANTRSVLLVRGVIGVAAPSARVSRIEHMRVET